MLSASNPSNPRMCVFLDVAAERPVAAATMTSRAGLPAPRLLWTTMTCVASFLSGCAEPQDPAPVSFPTTGIHDGDAGEAEGDDEAADETGDPGPSLVDGCISEPQLDGTFGFRHQCLGEINVELHAKITGIGAIEVPVQVLFGQGTEGDSYEAPLVMACCHALPVPSPPGHHTFETLTPEPHYKACYRDMLEQMCRSIPGRLYAFSDELKADNHLIAANQATELGNHMAENTQMCANAFIEDVEGYDPDIGEDFLRLQGSFTVPDDSKWGLIEDIEFVMDSPSSVVFDLFLPSDEEDWATCVSDDDNNDFLFTQASVEPLVVGLASGNATIEGPQIGWETIDGAASLASRSTSCDRCSSISLGWDEVDVWIGSLELIVEDAAVVGTSSSSMLVERVRVALYSPGTLAFTSATEAYVPTGEARFLVSALAEGEAGAITAQNAGPIEVEFLSGGDIVISPFDIEYDDASHDDWTLSISTLTFDP